MVFFTGTTYQLIRAVTVVAPSPIIIRNVSKYFVLSHHLYLNSSQYPHRSVSTA
jgi:hypothetical protein